MYRFWRGVMLIKLDIEKKWLSYKLVRNYKKQIRLNNEILKATQELIDLKQNPPKFLKSLFYCMLHPISFAKYLRR